MAETISRVRKQGKQKIIGIPMKEKGFEFGSFVLIKKINLKTESPLVQVEDSAVSVTQHD